jgi:lipid A ethanolaminephosphotransferase
MKEFSPLPQAEPGRSQDLSDATGTRTLRRFWGPKYWPTWLFIGWLKLAASLPVPVAIKIHKGFGRVLGIVLGKRRRLVERNLELCFPELLAHEVRALANRNFENIGACIAELAFAWFGSPKRLAGLVKIEGQEHIEAALKRGEGIIVLSGHFTTLEICVPLVKTVVPYFAFMFSPRRNDLLNAVQIAGRQRAAHASFPNSNVRTMLRLLREKAAVWYAPDQAATGNSGALLQFFGEPAMINTATSRLARISGATVVPLFFRRDVDDCAYTLRFEAPLEHIPSQDPTYDTIRLTQIIEKFVRECPEQYFWIHRIFKGRPRNFPNAYGQDGARKQTPQNHKAAAKGRSRFLSAPLAIIAVSLFIVGFDNGVFWREVGAGTLFDEHRIAIVVSLFGIVFCTLVIAQSLALGTRAFKFVAASLLVLAAASGYYMNEYGIVFDTSMVRNIVETETREAAPLLTGAFLTHILLFGVLPALLVILIPIRQVSWKCGLAARAGTIAACSLTLLGTLYANYGAVSFFAHEHHSVRLFINPAYPIYSYIRFLFRDNDKAPVDRIVLDARISVDRAYAEKPTLLVFVVGETARADRFGFNGYARDTNPYTRARGTINFSQVSSCGTSTADSLPCLFAHLGRSDFSHATASAYENVIYTLQRLGVDARWRDNSTGCKGVCDPEHFEQLATRDDPTLCDATGCFDEILLEDLTTPATNPRQDRFIVLHQRGSHGPAYYTDTPAWSKRFLPECDLPNLRNCSLDEINNAYDNTIVYTDYFLSRVIDFLDAQSDNYDVAMLYVSDHGESLGENGLYLHGFPYAIAPKEQTRVPMLFWASQDFYDDRNIDASCVRASAHRTLSHDAIFHSVLPLFHVEAARYEKQLDLFAKCRTPRRHNGRTVAASD